MINSPNRARRGPTGETSDRGAALVELAIALPIFVAIIALIFDMGVGFNAARESASVARSAARVAALAGEDRLADYRAIDAVRAAYSGDSNNRVTWVTVYRSSPGSNGSVPAGCEVGSAGLPGLCNGYAGSMLDSYSRGDFAGDDCVGAPDEMWCPLDRGLNSGDYLGVAVWTQHEPTVGLFPTGDISMFDTSVFALFFP